MLGMHKEYNNQQSEECNNDFICNKNATFLLLLPRIMCKVCTKKKETHKAQRKVIRITGCVKALTEFEKAKKVFGIFLRQIS